MSTKNFLDEMVKKYEVPEFIDADPIRFPHMFDNQKDQEVSGLISAVFSYGRRESIIKNVQKIFEIMEYKPYEFVVNFNFVKDRTLFENVDYRLTKGTDIALLIHVIGVAVNKYGTLEKIFMEGFSEDDKNIKSGLINFVNKILSYAPENVENLAGLSYLMSSPAKKSSCKRLNMFLRWMVRPGPVDFHLWKKIPASKLIIPLDTHVSMLSRKLNLTAKQTDIWPTAEEITEKLKQFDPADPVKYDFAIFGMGVSNSFPEECYVILD